RNVAVTAAVDEEHWPRRHARDGALHGWKRASETALAGTNNEPAQEAPELRRVIAIHDLHLSEDFGIAAKIVFQDAVGRKRAVHHDRLNRGALGRTQNARASAARDAEQPVFHRPSLGGQ